MDQVITNGNIVKLRERGKTSIVSAVLSKAIMSDDTAKYRLLSSAPLNIKINSTIDIFGKIYRVNNKPQFTKTAEKSYAYDIVFEGVLFDLRKCMLFNADDTGFKTDSDFSLIGTIEVFLLCLKNNIKRLSPIWKIGTFENKETKTITFSKDNCLTALQKICQEFKVEFRIDNANGYNIINVGNFGKELPYTFEYGKGKGLYELASTNVDENGIINRMYVSGGSENLPNNYQNYATNLKLPGGIDYLEDAASIAFIGLKEGFIEFPDIYPHRTGVISAIDANKKVFFDASMDFDLNEKEEDGITTKYLKPDVTAKVHFNTGNLAGYEFEIKKNGYDHATKKFEVIQITNEALLKFPSDTAAAFQFKVGDEYVILDIYYPEIYVTNAENKLLEEAEEQFPLNLQPKVNYKLKVDENYLKSKVSFPEDIPFDLGDTVTVIDATLGINKKIKIVSFNRNILSPFAYEIEIADSYEINFASQVALQIIGINNTVTNQSTVIAQNYLNGYRRLNELSGLVFDPDGYFDTTRIKPLSIETNMLSVGAKSQQLTLEGVTIEPNYLTSNGIKFSAGKLIHFSISDVIVEWNFIETIIDGLTSSTAYYVYAKCAKSGTQGEFYVSADKIKFDSLPTNYYFLLGVLHKENDGFRFYTPLEGATLINGRYITTGKVQSVDGSTWFDLDLAAFDLGGTAGMSGQGEETGAFLWGGGTFFGRETAKRTLHRNGIDRWRHPNGNIGFEMGIIDGILTLNGYSSGGAKLFELDPNRGLVNVGYIPRSWYSKLVYVTEFTTEEGYDSLSIKSTVEGLIEKLYLSTYTVRDEEGLPHTFSNFSMTLQGNNTIYDYFKGTNPDYASTTNGFVSEYEETEFVPDGWYIMEQELVNYVTIEGGGSSSTLIEIPMKITFIKSGKIKTINEITITK